MGASQMERIIRFWWLAKFFLCGEELIFKESKKTILLLEPVDRKFWKYF